MPCAKTKTLLKQETSKAKEEQLQIAVLAYQTALKSDEIMSIQQVAQHFQVPHSTLQNRINGHRSFLEVNVKKSWLADGLLDQVSRAKTSLTPRGTSDHELMRSSMRNWVNPLSLLVRNGFASGWRRQQGLQLRWQKQQ